MLRLFITIYLVALVGCGTRIEADPSAFIACISDSQCPSGLVCVESSGVCSDAEVEQVVPATAPVTSVEDFNDERRFIRSVPFDLGLLDVNASLENPEEITLELNYFIGDGNKSEPRINDPGWREGTITYTSPWVLDEATLQVERVSWATLEDAESELAPNQGGVARLVSAVVDEVGDGSASTVVGFVQEVWLRVRAVDKTGATSPWSSTPPFTVGNETPRVELTAWPSVSMSGLVPLEFEIADSSGDAVTIDVQFRRGPSDTWRWASIIQGDTEQVLTSPEARRYVLVWDSYAEPNEACQTELELACTDAQGVGATLQESVEVRIRATDSPAENVLHHSLWSTPVALPSIDNRP